MESHNVLNLVCPILLILGGVLGASALIVAKRPDAASYIAKIQPFQALIGFGLLGVGIWTLLRWIAFLPGIFKDKPFNAAVLVATIAVSILLGIIFGMPVLARFSPQGARKGEEMHARLAPFQVLIGLAAIAAGVLNIVNWLGIDLG
jgi:hypothetical protein